MKLGAKGEALIKRKESCVLFAYPDPASPLGIALQHRGLWNKHIAGKADIPFDLLCLSGAPWTIGYGHTGPEVKQGLRWTQQQADEAFKRDVAPFETLVNTHVKVPLTQGQFDALVSIIYNVGPGRAGQRDGIIWLKTGSPSTLLRKLNLGDYVGAGRAFLSWNRAGGAVVRGLEIRRGEEADMFMEEVA